jgi:hypothetical protein
MFLAGSLFYSIVLGGKKHHWAVMIVCESVALLHSVAMIIMALASKRIRAFDGSTCVFFFQENNLTKLNYLSSQRGLTAMLYRTCFLGDTSDDHGWEWGLFYSFIAVSVLVVLALGVPVIVKLVYQVSTFIRNSYVLIRLL